MTAPILKEIIASKLFKKYCPDVKFKGNQLTGDMTITSDERVELLNNMFRKSHFSYIYKKSKPTTITIATKDFHCGVDGLELGKLTDYHAKNIGYKAYKLPYETVSFTKHINIEEIATVFSIITNDQVVGFYDFNLALEREVGQATLNLHLNQIYVKPEFRGGTYWMDLTISVYMFAGMLLHQLANSLKKPNYLDVYVHADFSSKSDEKIAVMIEREMRAMYEALPELSTEKPAFIGKVYAEMGY